MGILKSDTNKIRVGITEPNEVAGLVLDWKPESLGLSNGDRMASWVDSVSSKLFSQTDESNKALFETDSINGYPILSVIGSNRTTVNLVDIENVIAGDFTLFCLAKCIANTLILSTDNSAQRGFRLRSSSNAGVNYAEFNADGSARLNLQSPLNYVTSTKMNLICVNVKRGGKSYVRSTINNRYLANSSTPTFVPTLDKPALYLNGTGNNAQYGRLILFNQSHDEATENAVYRGLQLKYKI